MKKYRFALPDGKIEIHRHPVAVVGSYFDRDGAPAYRILDTVNSVSMANLEIKRAVKLGASSWNSFNSLFVRTGDLVGLEDPSTNQAHCISRYWK